jgi:O-acetyl-ADP-ribose deacetylase (regulator of RNase III)
VRVKKSKILPTQGINNSFFIGDRDMANAYRVFVAMKYKRNDDLYHLGIEDALERVGMKPIRIDHQSFTGSIISRIKSEISKSSMLIAEITEANPNVFLEIGYAWGIDCPTILLAKEESEFPFDVRDQKIILYKTITNLRNQLITELENYKLQKDYHGDIYVDIYTGDITDLEVDAIVNAANSELTIGSGVCGAIHKKAGPELIEACSKIPEIEPGLRCYPGDAKITGGYKLKAKYVIHTVGPIFSKGNKQNDDILRSCYFRSLNLAIENGVESIAFPAISTGNFGYPKDRAAQLAVKAIVDWKKRFPLPREVVFCCFEQNDVVYYQEALIRFGVQWRGEDTKSRFA